MTSTALVAFVAVSAVVTAQHADGKKPKFWVPTAAHAKQSVEGFTILVDPRLIEQKALCRDTLRELQNQLYQITRKVPKAALDQLKKVRIFVESRSETLCMAYHPSVQWLTQHDHNPDMAGSVELGNPKAFLSWTKAQPWMVLHELAHAYHHQFLKGGFGNKVVKACFTAATKTKVYESVLHINGRQVRAYAATNRKEYFAEASEALFGTNDMFPFVRAELRKHDPNLFAALRQLWEM